MRVVAALLLAALAPGLGAQESARFKLTEHARNAGGSPVGGTVVASPRFEIDPSSIGDGVARAALHGARFVGEAGFALAYRPAGEVTGLAIAADRRTLSWSPEPSVGHYDVYRDSLAVLPDLEYGTCLASGIRATTQDDPETPAAGQAWFYLVTATDRLDREGPKGWSSAGVLRANPSACP